jgi:hypothetical protein
MTAVVLATPLSSPRAGARAEVTRALGEATAAAVRLMGGPPA